MTIKENIFTVSEVTNHIKNVLESNIPNLFVEGEISNFVRHRSGHIYFSLKDSKSTIRCVFFKNYNLYLQFQPKDGDKVICGGSITVFEKSGNYQLNINRMYPVGIGELQLKFDELKLKLRTEGLFDEKYKKALKPYPEKIGVITSQTGAAIQDIKSVLSRRFPCAIYLYPATVQGEAAPEELIGGLDFFNKRLPVDLIILGRGGGSQEDLFCFNDENLARAIFASQIPVISAVGHEIDFTIADFVADLRAPTPSAAAELAVPDAKELISYINESRNRMNLLVSHKINSIKIELQELLSQLQGYHPRSRLQHYQQRLDESTLKLEHLIKTKLTAVRNKIEILSSQLKDLSPYEAVKRGYAIARQKHRILNSISMADKKDPLEVLLSDGILNCEIKEITEKKDW